MTYHWLFRSLALAAGLAAVLGQSACSELTEVDAPDVVQPGSLATPAGAETLRAGAVAAFTVAYGGAGLARGGQVVSTGTLTDEFTTAAPFDGDRLVDMRSVSDPADLRYEYAGLSLARVSSLQALAAMKQLVPEAVGKIAQLFAQIGYVELFFAENLCSGVPLSAVADDQPIYGHPLTTAELLARALEDLDSAAVYAADSARVLNMVRVARGRTLLQQGRIAEAAQAVGAVPTSYVFVAEFAANQPNGVYEVINIGLNRGVSDREGTNGLDFRSASDPRVPTTLLGMGRDGVTPVHVFENYNSPSSPIPFATGIEARLIEAEAALQANPNDASVTGNGWLGILNALRATATTPPLVSLTDPESYDARVDLLFRERVFWLFATGHRHGDLRRLVRQYGRTQDEVFPTGSYKGEALYGSDVTFTVPVDEGPNPNWSGQCLSRDA